MKEFYEILKKQKKYVICNDQILDVQVSKTCINAQLRCLNSSI